MMGTRKCPLVAGIKALEIVSYPSADRVRDAALDQRGRFFSPELKHHPRPESIPNSD